MKRRLAGWSSGRGSHGQPLRSSSSAFTGHWSGGELLCHAAKAVLRTALLQRTLITQDAIKPHSNTGKNGFTHSKCLLPSKSPHRSAYNGATSGGSVCVLAWTS